MYIGIVLCFFKQRTAYEMRISDWSSDVCSSDLLVHRVAGDGAGEIGAFESLGVIPTKVGISTSRSEIPTFVGMTGKAGMAGEEGRDERFGNQEPPAAAINQHIFDLRPVSQSLIDRDRPGRRRPDHRICADEFGDR